MFPGIADRMQKELTALAPSSTKVCLSLHCCFLKLAVFDLRSDGLFFIF
jgi:actin-related protein